MVKQKTSRLTTTYTYDNLPVGRVDFGREVLKTVADLMGIGWSTYD